MSLGDKVRENVWDLIVISFFITQGGYNDYFISNIANHEPSI